MKKYVVAAIVSLIALTAMMLGSKLKFFIDLPSFILILILGGLSLYLLPEKKSRSFIEAGWLIFAIGIVAGSFSLNESGSVSAFAANIAVSSIGLVYGYLLGIITDILLKKDH